MSSQALAQAIHDRYAEVRQVLEPRVRSAVAATPLMDPDFAVAVNVTQNVLKECMGVSINEALPQNSPYFVELATRVCCYVLTCLHPDEQEAAALVVQRAILSKLADMQASGATLRGEWT